MPSSQFTTPNEPDENNIIQLLEATSTRYQSIEQMRWNESNVDVKFWAGDQDYVYSYFQYAPSYGWKKFFFNIIQQPCNMITGYQRQHRKSYSSIPVEGSDQLTSDQLNKVLTYCNSKEFLLETFSDSCEQAVNSGFNIVMPYLSYDEDFTNGNIKWKIWEFNSFIIDPYFRDTTNMSDCNFCWFQKYLSKHQAMIQFPGHAEAISNMSGYTSREGKFYFLPENYNIARTDLLVLSYYWYKSTRRKKMLFNRKTGETTDFFDTEENINEYTQVFEDLEVIEKDIPTWKVATVLNKTVLYIGTNPLAFDECPFVPVYWNYDPFIPEPNLRVRSLVRSLRDAQFLFNRRLLINHDLSESSLNSGFMYEEDSVANEEVFKYAGQGKDIQVKSGTQRWPEKIIPNAVPPSDLELANQLMQIIPSLSGVNEELLGMSQEKGLAGITQMLRQGAGLVTLQKYFDQWDKSLKQLGKINMRIIQNKWYPFKIQRIIGEAPSDQFKSKNFQQYDILTEEALNTTVQKQFQFAQLLEFQRETGIQIPPKLLLENSTLQGKNELIQALEEQQKQSAQMQQETEILQMALMEGKLENQRADTAEKLAMARERTGRTKSNVGLFEERISEVTENRARAIKEKVSALKELLDTLRVYGELTTKRGSTELQNLDDSQKVEEEAEKSEGKMDSQEDLSGAGLTNILR